MEFQIKEKQRAIPRGYSVKEIEGAKAIAQELASFPFVKAALLSRIDAEETTPLYVLLDNVTEPLTKGMVDSFVKKSRAAIMKHHASMQVHPIKLSEHWERFVKREARYLNLLRYGIVVHDVGILEPVTTLLAEGRLRPSKEAFGVLYSRTSITLRNANQHILQAVADLYWAAMDAAHAAMMSAGKMPPAPHDMADELSLTFVHRKMLEAKYPALLKKLYELYKHIEHRQVVAMKGIEWEALSKETESFIERMRKLIEAQGL